MKIESWGSDNFTHIWVTERLENNKHKLLLWYDPVRGEHSGAKEISNGLIEMDYMREWYRLDG